MFTMKSERSRSGAGAVILNFSGAGAGAGAVIINCSGDGAGALEYLRLLQSPAKHPELAISGRM